MPTLDNLTASPLDTTIFYSAAALCFIALTCLIFAIIGKKISDHTHCKKCKYSLHKIPATKCPECGQDITKRTSLTCYYFYPIPTGSGFRAATDNYNILPIPYAPPTSQSDSKSSDP